MKDIMLADLPIEEREEILRNSCDQILERTYTRRFEQNETNARRTELADVIIQIADIEQEFAEIKADFKGRTKPLHEKVAKLRDDLKVGGERIKGDCYKFVDEEIGMVGIYSPEGYLLESRPMTQEEKQRNIFRELRTGTEG